MNDLSALCGASARTGGPMPYLGPCVLRHGHDGPVHQDAGGVSWTAPVPATAEASEALCPLSTQVTDAGNLPDLRKRDTGQAEAARKLAEQIRRGLAQVDDSANPEYVWYGFVSLDDVRALVNAVLAEPTTRKDSFQVRAETAEADAERQRDDVCAMADAARRVATYWRDAAMAGDPGRNPADSAVAHACACILSALTSPEQAADVLRDLRITDQPKETR